MHILDAKASRDFRHLTVGGLIVGLHCLFFMLLGMGPARYGQESIPSADAPPPIAWAVPLAPLPMSAVPVLVQARAVATPDRPHPAPRSNDARLPKPIAARDPRPAVSVQAAAPVEAPVEAPAGGAGTATATPAPGRIDYATLHATVARAAREAPAPRTLDATERLSALDRFGREVQQGARKNCETAHADKGLIGIPFLLIDTLSGSGCKW